ncbi:Flp pilus assembly protein CpaB [Arthrobacter sp. HY1533]|uniref:Flp pilus assembly protein CpaB n=1 Tax=Arthrobacter sp. HY1533 TaxID=2970919 RepID=UPI0022BA0429|nr:RcpC/CpaB family pilus assembly protein [Arthrobacter sp. HY1533]
MKARLLGGIAAILLAIIGTVLLVNYVGGADSRAMAGTDTKEVLVVSKDIAAGTEVSKFGDSVQTKQVPAAMVVEGALANLGDVEGKVAAMPLLPGDQLSAARLSDAATFKGSNPVKVPDTMQQLSFSVTSDRVVGGQLQPGDYAALFLSYNAGIEPGTAEVPASKLTLRKALVVSMQASGQTQTEAPGTSTSPDTGLAPKTVAADSWVVTVALAPADGIKLVHAAEFGHIWVAKEATTAGNTPAPLFKGDVFK